MLKMMYSIKDNVSGEFDVPFHAENSVIAMRQFTNIARNPSYNVNKWPKEFDLYHVGAFDPEAGTFQFQVPTKLFNAKDAIDLYEKNNIEKDAKKC